MGEANIKREAVETGVKQACGNCKHYARADINKGACRYNPPQVCAVVSPQGVMRLTSFPEVSALDAGCGQHQKALSFINS